MFRSTVDQSGYALRRPTLYVCRNLNFWFVDSGFDWYGSWAIVLYCYSKLIKKGGGGQKEAGCRLVRFESEVREAEPGGSGLTDWAERRLLVIRKTRWTHPVQVYPKINVCSRCSSLRWVTVSFLQPPAPSQCLEERGSLGYFVAW